MKLTRLQISPPDSCPAYKKGEPEKQEAKNFCVMKDDSEGPWVSYKECVALEAENKELKAKCEAQRAMIEHYQNELKEARKEKGE